VSDPVNGAPPAIEGPQQNPRELPPGFAAFPTLAACLIMDRTTADLQVTIGQLLFLGQRELANVYQSALQQLTAVRNEWYRREQGGLILAGPGDMPPSRA
jgi:hypothetical protein